MTSALAKHQAAFVMSQGYLQVKPRQDQHFLALLYPASSLSPRTERCMPFPTLVHHMMILYQQTANHRRVQKVRNLMKHTQE